MMAVSHKWLGDSWHLVGDFRKARDHHTKHMQFNSADVSDLSGESGVRDKTQVLALCRQERLTGAAAKYVLDSVAKTSIDQQQHDKIRIPPKDLALAVQVCDYCMVLDSLYGTNNYVLPCARSATTAANNCTSHCATPTACWVPCTTAGLCAGSKIVPR